MLETIRDDRQMRVLTGVSPKKFTQLLPVFSWVYHQEQYKAYQEAA
jgi:hypothetical protein